MTPDLVTDPLAVARATLLHASQALAAQAERLGDALPAAVEVLAAARGKVVTSGVGKSGLVAQRLAATLTSTGTPAVFLHPTDAVHGDAGLLQSGDAALFLSKSGGSEELEALLDFLDRLEIPLVALTTRRDSPLGRAARVVIETGDLPEPGPLDFVPTTSAVIFQSLGDALALALVARRGFTARDFSFLHPGGVLGRAMRLTAGQLMHGASQLPRVAPDATLRQVLVEILEKRLGITTVVGEDGRLLGVVTDGDVKRIALEAPAGQEQEIWKRQAAEVLSPNPRTCSPDTPIARAVREMEENAGGAITALVVVDEARRPMGVLHLHDCLRAGLAR